MRASAGPAGDPSAPLVPGMRPTVHDGGGGRFTTVEELVLAVVKRSGGTEPFSRDKIVRGVRRACQGRPVDQGALQQLAHRVEEAIRSLGSAEVPSQEVGLAILGPLRNLMG